MEEEKKYFGSWFVWVVILLIGALVVFTCLDYVGIIGRTVVERKVFEQSYQKKAADSDSLSTYDAQLSILRRRLRREDLSREERDNIQAQIDAITILKSTKSN
jgi:hypothetical protein